MDKLRLWGYPALLITVVTCAVWLLRNALTLANFTMIYLVLVLVLAIGRGTRVALVAAFISFLCINFFLIQPYYTFLIADPREVLDLIVFFLVAALVGQLATRARQQAERARKSQQFEEADRLKTALLHAVSHDLRTPITIIKTSASNLRTLDERLSSRERRELSESIEQEADHLDKLIGNLLDMSRLRAGALTLNRQLNSLEEAVGDVAAEVYENTRQERIHLNFPPDFPLVCFDYGLMLRAISNLIDNALRYALPDSSIELRGEVIDREVQLWVTNQGEAIPVNEREHIMEPFYRGEGGHIGLGLAIARGIVEAHQGRLWLEDTPGGGATFIIALPLAKEQVNVT